MRLLLIVVTLLAGALSLAACGDDDGGDAGNGSATPAPVSVGASIEPDDGAESPSATARQSPANVLPSIEALFAAAMEAAQATLDASTVPGLTLNPDVDQAGLTAGIAVFGVNSDTGGYEIVLGQDADGVWRFWHTAQNRIKPLVVPGPVVLCGGSDRTTPVRSDPEPAAAVLATLLATTSARAEDFVLTDPGTFPDKAGFGWYRLSAPDEGWVSSEHVLTQCPNPTPAETLSVPAT